MVVCTPIYKHMTSLICGTTTRLSFHQLHCQATTTTTIHAKMSRGISPPSAKRRKTSAQTAVPTQTSSSNAPAALPPLEANTLRIFSWNINGITPFLQKPITSFFQSSKSQASEKDAIPPASLRGFLHRHKWPAMLFLQEVKIASKDTKTQDAVKSAVNSRTPSELGTADAKGPLYEAHFVLPDDPYNARGLRGSGKVYGVCSILRKDLSDKYDINIRTVDWDREGRITVVEVKSKSDSSKLAVFNIYAVNGTDNPYRDPATGAVKGTRHDRKLEVHRLLMQECKDLEKEGWDVLLGGDMNVALDARDGHPKLRTFPQQHDANRVDFHNKLLEGEDGAETGGLKGVDVWRKMHGEERRYTYFSRGREWGTSCDRVDYFIAGRSWEKGCIRACGIMDSEAERGPSDHVPIWVDFELQNDETSKEDV
jgi:exonuclease III